MEYNNKYNRYYFKMSELIAGNCYVAMDNSNIDSNPDNSGYLFKCVENGNSGGKNRFFISSIRTSMTKNDGSLCSKENSSFSIDMYYAATYEQTLWINECIKQNKFIPFKNIVINKEILFDM